MTGPRTHLTATIHETLGPRALCGWWGGKRVRYTTDEDAVTCARCRTRIAEPAEPTYAERLEAGVGRIETGAGTRVALRLPERVPDDERVKPWPNWRMALRDSLRANLDGSPLKSTTATSRFGRRLDGGNSGFAPEGDAGQRQVARYYAVRRALDRAFGDGFLAMTTPRRWVPPLECRAILCAAIVGRVAYRDLDFRRAVSPGERRKRGTIPVFIGIERRSVGEAASAREDDRRRDDESDVELYICGPASKRVGFAVTAGHVSEIVRMGGIAIEDALRDGKWLATSDESLHRAGPGAEESGMADETRLRGWKSIAAHIGVAESTARDAQRWSPPIPVVVFGGRVEADPDELSAWRNAGAKAIAMGAEAAGIAGRTLGKARSSAA